MLCLHGFTDTWRTWELVLGRLERHNEVLAPTLAGHAGGPALYGRADEGVLLDELERAMDAAGFATAHIVGNSLGGYLALHLAARGRAESVVALAPAGGWAEGDESARETMAYFVRMRELLIEAAPNADQIVSTDAGRRRATMEIATNYEHIPAELLAHQIRGVADCTGAPALIEQVLRHGWWLDAAAISCPVRVIWGAADRILPWPSAALRYREQWLAQADWVVLEDVGHCPQLDIPLETSELILRVPALSDYDATRHSRRRAQRPDGGRLSRRGRGGAVCCSSAATARRGGGIGAAVRRLRRARLELCLSGQPAAAS